MILDTKGAIQEILSKSEGQIQRETAYKWASRAMACYWLYGRSGDMSWALRAEEYRHEAIEHAAVAEDDCRTLRALEHAMEREARAAGVRE